MYVCVCVCVCFVYSALKSPREKWESNEAVHRLIIDSKQASDSVRRENEFRICMKLVLLTKILNKLISESGYVNICLPTSYSNVLKGDVLQPLIIKFAFRICH
jgi:hypothetical protein